MAIRMISALCALLLASAAAGPAGLSPLSAVSVDGLGVSSAVVQQDSSPPKTRSSRMVRATTADRNAASATVNTAGGVTGYAWEEQVIGKAGEAHAVAAGGGIAKPVSALASLGASLGFFHRKADIKLENSSALIEARSSVSCIAKCSERRAECRSKAQVLNFHWHSCMAPCHTAKHECARSCDGRQGLDLQTCQQACNGPHAQCRSSCRELRKTWRECHSDTWRSCKRVCKGMAVEAGLSCKYSCSTRGDTCSQMAGTEGFERSACATACINTRKGCQAACTSDSCREQCKTLSSVCNHVCSMKKTAAKTCRSKVSECHSNSCQPMHELAKACRHGREECCADGGVGNCKMNFCWNHCKVAQVACKAKCAGGAACRRACRTEAKECRGACHDGRMKKRACWSSWASCLEVAAPQLGASHAADGASLAEHENDDADAEHGAAEEEEDEQEDEEWQATEDLSLGEDIEEEAESIEDAVVEDVADAPEEVAVSHEEVLVQRSASSVKTLAGCPSGNGMQTVGDKWVSQEPEKCVAVSAGSQKSTANVRCCGGGKFMVPMKKYGVCKDLTARTYKDAVEICAASGLHLCSVEELWADKTCKSGCGFDRSRVWTSSTCSVEA